MKSPEPGAAILVAAASGRALAGAARRAGYRPLVADFFGDADTCEIAAAHRLVEDGLDSGFRADTLLPALEALAEDEEPAGVVHGAGFEDRVELLDEIASRWTLFGNPPSVVRRVKDPVALATLCAALGIPHPEIRLSRPEDCATWLVKSIGGSGGTHVAPANAFRVGDEGLYYQRIAAGEPVSILFLGDGTDACVIGASRQWPMPALDEPFRYGGCLRPAGLSPGLSKRLDELAREVCRACALFGLNSIDLLVEGDTFTLIEINPRPGATLDIFEDDMGSLFSAHLEACHGRLPRRPLDVEGAAAAAIAYARRDVASMPMLDWPDWAADRQRPRTRLRGNDPLCTITARAAEPARARALVDERRDFILDTIDHMQEGTAS